MRVLRLCCVCLVLRVCVCVFVYVACFATVDGRGGFGLNGVFIAHWCTKFAAALWNTLLGMRRRLLVMVVNRTRHCL